jgi:Ca2+-binding EF-hand superfamily protein
MILLLFDFLTVQHMTNKEENALMAHFDTNQNGRIHFDEFAFAFFNRRR